MKYIEVTKQKKYIKNIVIVAIYENDITARLLFLD